jgi:uncharacterized protein YeaO (DUF488 family)
VSAIGIKRAYEAPAASDGARVLVDRIWPRGLTREKVAIDRWMKELSPSGALRKWYGHAPELFGEFRRRYRDELKENKAALDELVALCRKKKVTLVFAARDTDHSNAAVLKELLEERLRRELRR